MVIIRPVAGKSLAEQRTGCRKQALVIKLWPEQPKEWLSRWCSQLTSEDAFRCFLCHGLVLLSVSFPVYV